jgi:endonuclease/exonuclease/phosphatase family metal-dependent hydrolase
MTHSGTDNVPQSWTVEGSVDGIEWVELSTVISNRTWTGGVNTWLKSGKKFFFIATHGPLKKEANGHAGRLLVEFDKKYNKEGLPTIVVGDMNARPGQTFHNNMLTHYEDCFLVAEKKCGTIGTFNSSGEIENNFTLSHRRIDHIYVRSTDNGKIRVVEYNVDRTKSKINGELHYPSDHNPVVVELTLK